MSRARFVSIRAAVFAAASLVSSPAMIGQTPAPTTGEMRLPVGAASLYAREVGRGRPLIVLHGGPDFDQAYLRPELDELADTYRLIYYDQRGRGQSAENVRPEDVTLASDLEDLDKVRRYFRLDAPVLLAHSWGTVLALEFALRNPTLVSHLVLMNPARVSQAQVAMLLFQTLVDVLLDRDVEANRHLGNPVVDTASMRGV